MCRAYQSRWVKWEEEEEEEEVEELVVVAVERAALFRAANCLGRRRTKRCVLCEFYFRNDNSIRGFRLENRHVCVCVWGGGGG